MHATHGIDAKNVITDAALDQGKWSWSECREKFPETKYFVSEDTVLLWKFKF